MKNIVQLSSSSFILWTSLFLCWLSMTYAAAFISGSSIKCFNEGESVKVDFLHNDPCLTCKCRNSEVICERDGCSHLDCTDNGRTFRNGESWSNQTCTTCTCNRGNVSCQVKTCDPNLTCPDTQRIFQSPGECCPSCVDNDGECSLLAINHQSFLTSFDRSTLSFKGKCNYVMTRDCIGKSFYVHLAHGPINITTPQHHTFGDDKTRSVVIRVEKTRIRLTRVGNSWHLRVGKKTSHIPFIRLGVMTVVKTPKSVLVRTNIGLKVSWDGHQDLRIVLPPKLKGTVCGLCGNFNGNPSDDRQSKFGQPTRSLQQLTESWKVGKVGFCREPEKEYLKTDQCSSNWKRKVEAIAICNSLKDSSLRPCFSRIAISPYYRKCMEDVCQCRSNDCHCTSIQKYQSRCRSIGVRVPNLKLESCPATAETDILLDIMARGSPFVSKSF